MTELVILSGDREANSVIGGSLFEEGKGPETEIDVDSGTRVNGLAAW